MGNYYVCSVPVCSAGMMASQKLYVCMHFFLSKQTFRVADKYHISHIEIIHALTKKYLSRSVLWPCEEYIFESANFLTYQDNYSGSCLLWVSVALQCRTLEPKHDPWELIYILLCYCSAKVVCNCALGLFTGHRPVLQIHYGLNVVKVKNGFHFCHKLPKKSTSVRTIHTIYIPSPHIQYRRL